MYKEILSARLKKAREHAELTQEIVAKELKISRNSISRYELGQREPDVETLGQLADLYNISVDWLIGLGRYKSEEQIAQEREREKVADGILKGLGS